VRGLSGTGELRARGVRDIRTWHALALPPGEPEPPEPGACGGQPGGGCGRSQLDSRLRIAFEQTEPEPDCLLWALGLGLLPLPLGFCVLLVPGASASAPACWLLIAYCN
jgi:hypothetical protein